MRDDVSYTSYEVVYELVYEVVMDKAIPDNRKNDSPNPDEEYRALLRALRRKQGFGLFFIQASPARGQKILQQLQTDLPAKRIVTVKLERTSEELFEKLEEVWQQQPVDVFWIEGLEQALRGYEDIKRLAGWGTEDLIHYSWQDVPPILAHLNLARERFAQQFPCALVFVVPLFVVKYLLRRAADFFDWKSGFFEFSEDVYGEVRDFVAVSNNETYRNLDPGVRAQRILEIKLCLDMPSLETDERASLFREIGRLFASEGNDETALLSYDRSLTLQPESHYTWFIRGDSLDNLKRYEEAVESFDRGIVFQQDNPYAWYRRGFSLSQLGRDEEAIESFDRAIAIKPDYLYAWFFRGIGLNNLGRYEEAVESYDRGIVIQPDDQYAWYQRGISLNNLGRDEETVESFNRAIAIQSDYHYAWNQRGITLGKLGRHKEAIESFDRVIALQPDYHYAWGNRGVVLYHLGRYETAITSYDKALAIQSDEEYIWFWKAKTLSRMGRSEDAISSYDKVLELQPDFSVACHDRALALAGIGRYEEAIIGFRKAIELKSDSSSATSWMCLGGALLRMGRYEESLASLDKAIEIRGEGIHWEWGGRVISLLKLGRFREAFVSSYKSLLSFRINSGFREWVERRIAIDLRRFGLQALVPVWTKFLSLIRWRVKDW